VAQDIGDQPVGSDEPEVLKDDEEQLWGLNQEWEKMDDLSPWADEELDRLEDKFHQLQSQKKTDNFLSSLKGEGRLGSGIRRVLLIVAVVIATLIIERLVLPM
jgi:hypothetical protein